MAQLFIQLIGSFSVQVDGKNVTEFQSNKVRGLLAYLAVESSRAHSREGLAGLLWPDYPNPSALSYLRNALSNLRQAIGDAQANPPFLIITRESIQLNPNGSIHLDVNELERQARTPGDIPENISHLKTAISLYRGPFLDGLFCDSPAFEEWALGWRERINRDYCETLGHLARAYSLQKDFRASIETARQLLALDPWDEEAHRLVMEGLAHNMQRGAALAQYENCKRILKDELGVEPSAETQQLAESIRSGQVGPAPEPKLDAGSSSPNPPLFMPLPTPLTSFVGREKEMQEITRRLLDTKQRLRLVTLTGAGGCGKTRLALALAHQLAEKDCYPQGVGWVDLSQVNDSEMVHTAIVRALGLAETNSLTAERQLLGYLRERKTLLVLDNCEHLIEAVAGIADKLLEACSGLQVLTTSREPLGVPGELIWRVSNLRLPDSQTGNSLPVDGLRQFDAINLFEERARTVSPEWQLEGNGAAVLAICARLDGIPLAIELAAARVRMMTVEQIQARLGDVFRLLVGGSRSVVRRHQTLRACIDWSYSLLSDGEQALLRFLSVFTGGWSLEAAEAIGKQLLHQKRIKEEALELLGQLVDRSLVVIGQDKNHNARYRMLETIRQYAQEKLAEAGEKEIALNIHLGFFFDIASQAEPELRGPDQVRWLDLIEINLDNFRAALEWALGTDTTRAMGLASRLFWLWWIRTYIIEGWEWLERSLAADATAQPADPEKDPKHAWVRAWALTADRWFLGRLIYTGYNFSKHGYLRFSHKEEGEEKLVMYDAEALDLYQRLPAPDRRGLAFLYLRQAIDTYDVKESKALLEKSLNLSTEAGDKFISVECINRFVRNAVSEGNLKLALSLSDKELALRKEIGDIEGLVYTYYQRGVLAYYHLHDYAMAEHYYKEADNLDRHFWSEVHSNLIPVDLALTAWKQNQTEQALRILDMNLDAGMRNSDEESIAIVLRLKAKILLDTDQQQARTLLEKTVRYWKKNDYLAYGVPTIAEDLACLYQKEGQLERASCMLGFVWNHQYFGENITIDYPRMNPIRDALLADLGEQAFSKAWSEGQSMTLEEAANYVQLEMGYID